MTRPSLCVMFNNVDDASSIGALSAWAVRTALAADWRVSVVARDLATDLRGEVEWLPLYVPPRLHAVQWYSALTTARRAVGPRRWDVVHVSQPQLVPMADLLHLHYLVRAAREHAPEQARRGPRELLGAAQARLTELGEERALRGLPDDLLLMPVSTYLEAEFSRRYGTHDRTTVLDSPAPTPTARPAAPLREQARRRYVGDRPGTVIGFLGGADPRKGGHQLLEAVAGTDGAVVLYGGAGLPDHSLVHDSSRFVGAGYVTDVPEFLAACDALAVVSTWDPGPLTALEAAAAQVVVIGTEQCGVVRDLLQVGGAVPWRHGDPFEPVLRRVQDEGPGIAQAAGVLLETRSEQRQRALLVNTYQRLLARPGRRRP